MQNRPSEESPCDLVRLKRHGWPRRKPMGLPSLLAEVSGGGFAGSPDVPANVTAAIVCPQYAGMHRVECETSGLARIFHSLSHRYDHLPASGSSDGGSQGICGLDSKPPLRGEIMRPRTTENSCLAQENPRNLAGLLAERSGGGFASSPDVPASALGPRIIDSLHAGCRVERETSGLAAQPPGSLFGEEARVGLLDPLSLIHISEPTRP